jgi:hypothetical protein
MMSRPIETGIRFSVERAPRMIIGVKQASTVDDRLVLDVGWFDSFDTSTIQSGLRTVFERINCLLPQT